MRLTTKAVYLELGAEPADSKPACSQKKHAGP